MIRTQTHRRMNGSRFRPFFFMLLLFLYPVAATVRAQEHRKAPEAPLSSVWGQKAWSSENGLPQNSVHRILQTRDGYLWIATEGGVARFNGIQFTVFNQESEPAFTSNDTCCLAEDRSGALWIGTSDGLLRYAGGAFRRYTTADGLPSAVVLSLTPTSDGSLLILTADGLARYDGQKFTPLTLSASALGTGSDSIVWLANATGIFSYNHEQLQAAPVFGLPTEPIEGLGSLEDGSRWARTRTAFLLWNQGRFQTWHSGRELPGTRVQSFLEDSHGTLWVGTDQGLVALPSARTTDNRRLESLTALGTNSILTMFEDREHNLWVGTDTTGLHLLQQQKFRTLPSLLGNPITAITQTADGVVWLGSKDDGLFRYEDGQTRHLSTKDGLLSDVILTLAADRDGSLWIGTPDGLNHLHGQKIESYTSADGLPDDFIRSLFADYDGTLWVGTRRGLAHRQHGQFTLLSRANGFKSDLIGAMLRSHSHSNDLWVGTLDGLVRIRGENLTVFTKAQGLSDDVITSLFEDTNHTLWVGTKEGALSRSSTNGFSPVNAHDLPREIDAIVEDAHGYLWFTSSRGIVRVLASELMTCGEATTCHPHVATFGSSDGMPTEETSSTGHPGAWKTTDGQLWFATRKGVAIVNPIGLRENQTPPPVVIERFMVDDTEMRGGEEITIPPGHIRYGFEYAALSYVSPSRVRYRYILEGFDKQWTQAGSRRNAYYTNLPPGHYRFRVQAANENGIWNEAGAEVAFVIRPPFYRTLWFLALAILLLAGIVYAIYKLRVRALRSQFDAVLAERTRIAREIHDTLAQDFVGVSAQLELTAHLLAQSQVLEATQQVDRTRDLVREGLADARRSIWDLRATGTQATLPMRLTRFAEQGSVDHLKTDVNIGGTYRALAPSLENEVFRIAQEAFTNIVRHANATHVLLNLRYHPNDLTLTISDNGIGFEAKGSTSPAEGHFGLQGMRERSKQINGVLNVKSSSGSGTTVTLTVPLLD